MLVKRFWRTSKQVKFQRGIMANTVVTAWKGWFLLGILPLYIETVEQEYKVV